MPTKVEQDAEMYVGKDYLVRFTEVDTEDLSQFQDLTYAFADDEYADSPHFTKSQGSGISVVGTDDEVARVVVQGSDTSGLSPGDYYHELETVDANGYSQVAATGEVTLQPSQTN